MCDDVFLVECAKRIDLVDVDLSERVVAFIGELAHDLATGAGKVARTTGNRVQSSKRLIGIRSFPCELSRTSVEIDIGTFTDPDFSLVEARTKFVIVSNRRAVHIVINGIGKGPRLSRIDRGVLQVLNHSSIGLDQWFRPFLLS